MNYKTKRKLLWGLIALLVLINLSAIVTLSYNKYLKNKQSNTETVENSENWDYRHKRIKNYVRKELQLDSIQFGNYCRLKDENIDNTRNLIRKMGDYQRSIIAEINKDEPDSNILELLSDSVGLQHKLLQKEMNRHFLAVKSILNAKQKQKFEQMLTRMEREDWMRKDLKSRKRNQDTSNNRNMHRHRFRNGNRN